MGVDIDTVMLELGRRGIIQLMVEGGGHVQTSFLREGLVDELRMYFGGKVLGSSAKSWSQLACTSNIADSKPMRLVSVRKVDNHDFCATYRNLDSLDGKPSASRCRGAHNDTVP